MISAISGTASMRLATVTATFTKPPVMAPPPDMSMFLTLFLYSSSTRSVVTCDCAMRVRIASIRRTTSCKRW